MASLKHSDLIIDNGRSSITVLGKGGKKRAVWINADFKRKCQLYLGYKKRLGYSLDDDSYLLKNLHKSALIGRLFLLYTMALNLLQEQLDSHLNIVIY